MQSDKGQKAPGYNAQCCVDGEYKLIVVAEVSNECNDFHQMTPMVDRLNEIKKELEIETETKNIMDSGYDNENEILKNKDKEGIEIIVQPKKSAVERNRKKSGKEKIDAIFQIDDFKYDKSRNLYTCPAGKELKKQYTNTEKSGRKTICYQCKECSECKIRAKCTSNKKGRSIYVSANKKEMDEFYTLMKEKTTIAKKRKEIVEHPFGTLKRNMGFTYFMQRKKENVEAEFKFMSFIYNLKRVLNIVPMKELMQSIAK